MRAAGQRLPERPGADAENQQERGAGAPVADQPGFPALPAVLLQVLPVAEGESGSAWQRFPADPAPRIPWGGSEPAGCAGSRCRVAGVQSALNSQPGIPVTVPASTL